MNLFGLVLSAVQIGIRLFGPRVGPLLYLAKIK